MKQKKPSLKTAFLEIEEPWERVYLEKRLGRGAGNLYLKETAQDAHASIRAAGILSIFIKSRVDAGLLRRLPNLRFITTRSTGFDHIDLKACARRRIAVSNVPVYGENTVAEHTFALILSLSRNLQRSYLRTVQNDFSIRGLMGFDLKGKTLGVIGTGHIGLHVIRTAVAFGMKVIAFDVKKNGFLSEVLGFEYVSQETLFRRSDIISLHVPYTPATHHLINRKSIRGIKKGCILINTARGGLVETEALLEALDTGILRGAGLDVLEREEYLLEEKRWSESDSSRTHWSRVQAVLKSHDLLGRENVIYTPHLAFYSKEAVQRILDTTIENIQGMWKGVPVNRVA